MIIVFTFYQKYFGWVLKTGILGEWVECNVQLDENGDK